MFAAPPRQIRENSIVVIASFAEQSAALRDGADYSAKKYC